MMAVIRLTADVTKGKKMGNTQSVCKEKEPKESFDLRFLWVSLYFACSALLGGFLEEFQYSALVKATLRSTGPIPSGMSLCGESSGHWAGTGV